MKSRDAVIRLKRFEVEEKQRKVAEIEAMIAEFNHMATDLDRQIAIEQERAGVSDVNHYAYPTFAKAAIQRRDNLATSVAGLEAKLAAARGGAGRGGRGSEEDRAPARARRRAAAGRACGGRTCRRRGAPRSQLGAATGSGGGRL